MIDLLEAKKKLDTESLKLKEQVVDTTEVFLIAYGLLEELREARQLIDNCQHMLRNRRY